MPAMAAQQPSGFNVSCPKCAQLLVLDGPELPSQIQCPTCHTTIMARDFSTVNDAGRTIDFPKRDSEPAPAIADFEILDILGKGGMGVVYRARDLKLRRLVAIKMIRMGKSTQEASFGRFRKEAEAIARLQNPHCVQIYSVGECATGPYFVMELVEGGSLGQHTAAPRRIPERRPSWWRFWAGPWRPPIARGSSIATSSPAISICSSQIPRTNLKSQICNLQSPKSPTLGLPSI